MSATLTGPIRTAPTTLEPAGEHTPIPRPEAPIGPLLPVVGSDARVPTVHGHSVRYVNLDYAASSPALQAVADLVCEALPGYASVHRGAGFHSQVSTELYEQARAEIAAFVGARADDVCVIVRNTTDALNLLAAAVPADQEVVVFDLEHHANLLPWTNRAHRVLATADTVAQTLQNLTEDLRRRPAALVSVTGASNVTGEVLPLSEIVAIAHAHGARVAVDAAQLAPHRRIDLQASGVDYIAFSGHKNYAPFGAGVLVGRRDWLDAAAPHLRGGGAVRAVHPDGTAEWAPAPQRHEGGSPNVLGAAALAASCRALSALPQDALRRHEDALRSRLVQGLTALPGIRLVQIWSDSPDAVGVVSFTVHTAAGELDPGRVAAYLSAEHGIGVRDGRFCAHPLLARLGVHQGALRASVGVGSRAEDIDRLLAALRLLLAAGENWDYALQDGRWNPVPDPRAAPAWAPWSRPGFGLSAEADAGSSPCQG